MYSRDQVLALVRERIHHPAGMRELLQLLKIPRDEFCHFIAGRATYVRDPIDGKGVETIEVRPGTCVHFPAGWSGICTVHETIRNAYMLR